LYRTAEDQFSRCQDQYRQQISNILCCTAIGDQKIINCVKGDCCSQQTAGSGNLQPCSLPHICKTTADNGTTDHVHGSCSNTPEENKRKMTGSVLDQISDILKCGKGKSCDHSGIFDSLRFWLKYQQIKEQWQKFHHFLHHRGDLCGSCKGVRSVKYSKKGVDVCGKQTCTHPGKAEQKEFSLPLSHTQRGNQQGRSHAKKYIFNICHACTAFPVAGSSANRLPVSRRSNQQ